MNNLLLSVKEVCTNYPLDEKILIVPGYGAGHTFCEALARSSGGWVNLHPETPAGLAQKIAGEYLAEKNITLLSGLMAVSIMEEVFGELEGRKALRYFARQGNSTGLVRAIISSIFELRGAGIIEQSLSVDSFMNAAKGEDMAALLKAYQCYLEDNNFIDIPGMLALALEIITSPAYDPSHETIFLLPSFLQLSPLEYQLIKAAAGSNLVLINPDPVYGLLSPAGGTAFAEGGGLQVPGGCSAPVSDVDRLPWLYQVEYSPPPACDGSLGCFHAYGMTNEVREIFRRIQHEGIPLDNVTVAYTTSEYIPVFHTLARSMGLGLTMEDGMPGSFTSPGRLLAGLLEWIRKDFAAGTLRELLQSGDLRLPAGKIKALTPLVAARTLRAAGIGWGRERYILLQEMAENLQGLAQMKVEEGDAEARRERLLRQSCHARELYKFLNILLTSLPVPDSTGKIAFRELTSSLAEILAVNTNIKDEIDAAALKCLVADLIQIGRLVSLDLSMEEALDRVGNLLGNFRVGACGPKPGHLHLASYSSVIWSNRPCTFIAGLDANNFPGTCRQDPVLLDDERKSIHPGLPLGASKPSEKMNAMALALASRKGRVVLSFSSYDVVENRTVYPSSLLLQAHRLLKGDNNLDYSNLIQALGKPAGYYPSEGKPALDELEWWVGLVLEGGQAVSGPESVKNCYQGIGRGVKALEARQSPGPTEYDGLIGAVKELDPRQNPGLVLSSSKIEYLAGCPFAYFMHHVLHIRPPEELDYDPGRWLDAMGRGALLHQLFCNFMRRVTAAGETANRIKHKDIITCMADELVEGYKKLVPVPGEVILKRELADIYRCCELFLTGEEAGEEGVPAFFEVPFGMGKEAVKEAGCGLAEPVEIKLADGTAFLLRGRIDRIDRMGDAVYSVWDYKTGSVKDYDNQGYLFRGRQVQHALYAIAAEEIIRQSLPGESPQVSISGYYFPTEKGEGRRVRRPQAKQAKLTKALNNLFDLLAAGAFVASDDGKKCAYCEYQQVCSGQSAVERSKELVRGGSACLEPWRRLKEID